MFLFSGAKVIISLGINKQFATFLPKNIPIYHF
jgi:hypothetical protein